MDREEMSHSPMKQWSIFSNVINYVQHSRNPLNFHFVMTKSAKLNKTVKIKDKGEILLKVNWIECSGRSREEYLNRYEGVKTEIVDTTRFDENYDLSITYLGRIDMTQDKDLMVGQRFPISKSGYTVGNLMDGMECQILLDTGASKSFMSISYYLHCKTLHSQPKLTSKTQRIQVGNGQYVSVLFIILVIVEIAGHRFEIYTLVSEIHGNSRECCFHFLNRLLPLFSKESNS